MNIHKYQQKLISLLAMSASYAHELRPAIGLHNWLTGSKECRDEKEGGGSRGERAARQPREQEGNIGRYTAAVGGRLNWLLLRLPVSSIQGRLSIT